MGESAREKLEGYTYSDYLQWPTDQTLMVFTLKNGEYGKPKVYAFPDHVPVEVLPEFTVDSSAINYCISED